MAGGEPAHAAVVSALELLRALATLGGGAEGAAALEAARDDYRARMGELRAAVAAVDGDPEPEGSAAELEALRGELEGLQAEAAAKNAQMAALVERLRVLQTALRSSVV